MVDAGSGRRPGSDFASVGVGPGGAVYVAWYQDDALFVARSADGGDRFGRAVEVDSRLVHRTGSCTDGLVAIPAQPVRCVSPIPALAVDPAGRVVVVYAVNEPGRGEEVYATSFGPDLAAAAPAGGRAPRPAEHRPVRPRRRSRSRRRPALGVLLRHGGLAEDTDPVHLRHVHGRRGNVAPDHARGVGSERPVPLELLLRRVRRRRRRRWRRTSGVDGRPAAPNPRRRDLHGGADRSSELPQQLDERGGPDDHESAARPSWLGPSSETTATRTASSRPSSPRNASRSVASSPA